MFQGDLRATDSGELTTFLPKYTSINNDEVVNNSGMVTSTGPLIMDPPPPYSGPEPITTQPGLFTNAVTSEDIVIEPNYNDKRTQAKQQTCTWCFCFDIAAEEECECCDCDCDCCDCNCGDCDCGGCDCGSF